MNHAHTRKKIQVMLHFLAPLFVENVHVEAPLTCLLGTYKNQVGFRSLFFADGHFSYLFDLFFNRHSNAGLGEAAVMLQRAWFHDPQTLPFAPFIQTHALVTLVQKGLQYYELERSLDQVCGCRRCLRRFLSRAFHLITCLG